MSRSKVLLAIGILIQTATVIYWAFATTFITGVNQLKQRGITQVLHENKVIFSGILISILFLFLALMNYIEERID